MKHAVVSAFQIVIDFIPHVRGHFETVYHEKKQLASSTASSTSKSVEIASPSVAETKQLEALQRQFDQVLCRRLINKISSRCFSEMFLRNNLRIVQPRLGDSPVRALYVPKITTSICNCSVSSALVILWSLGVLGR